MWENAKHPAPDPLRGALPEPRPEPLAEPWPVPGQEASEDTLAPRRRRGSKAQVEAVKAVRRTAAAAGFQLAGEQDDSVSHLSQTLAQINEDEDMAHLDGRLTFAERQIDRLASRRDQSDRLVDSELVVMRTRLEETLRAFAGATREHKDIVAAAERRLMALANEAERHTRAMLDSLRVELSLKVEEATWSAAHLEARLRGEKLAFEEEAARRASALAGSIAAGREFLEERVAVATDEMAARLESLTTALEARLAGSSPVDRADILGELEVRVGLVHARIDDARAEVLDAVQASEDKAIGAAEHLESMIRQLRRRLVGDEAEWHAVVGEAGDAVTALRARVEELLGRICAIEADGATARGSSGAQLGGVERRLDLHEDWSHATASEVSAQGLRLNAVEAQLSALEGIRVLVEEQAGAIEYLKGRFQGLDHPVEVPFDAVVAESDVAGGLERRLDELAVGQCLLSKRLDEIETRLSEDQARRRVWS